MPSRKMQIHPKAQEDVDAAYLWYLSHSEVAATRFLDEIENVKARAAAQPEWAEYYLNDTRRISLRRFPYSVIFRQIADEIVIIAVAHAKRDEAYWADR